MRPRLKNADMKSASTRIPVNRTRLGLTHFCMAWGLACAMLAATADAQSPDRWDLFSDTIFNHVTVQQGLPNPIVTSLAQDGDGFLWVGTQGGLGRWDGYRFRSYTRDSGNRPSEDGQLPDSYITTLLTDSRGQLWIGTVTGGLARYDRDHDRFLTYSEGAGGLSHGDVWAIAEDGRGGLWVGTDGGLNHLDPKTGAIITPHQDPNQPNGLPNVQVHAILRDQSGTLWVGTRTGLLRRAPTSNRFVPFPLAVAPGHSHKDRTVIVITLFEDSKNHIWIGTDQGAFVLDGPNGEARPVTETHAGVPSLIKEEINAIAELASGEIWLGTFHAGIFIVNTASGQTRHIEHDQAAPASLMNNQIYDILRDRAGSIWVGSDRGLDRYINDQGAVSTVYSALNRTGIDAAADVDAVMADPEAGVWLGYLSGGVDILNLTNGHIAGLRPDPSNPGSALPKGGAYAIARVGDAVYTGTHHGLYRSNKDGRNLTRVGMPQGYLQVGIRSLLADNDTLWIGSEGDGLFEIATTGSNAHLPGGVVQQRVTPDKLTNGNVIALARGNGNDLWMGTLIGLNRFDIATGQVERIAADPSDPAAISDPFISSLVLDKRGRLWVGTLGGGVEVMTSRDGTGKPRFRRLTVADGLPNANIDKLLLDEKGRIWASTDTGLAVIDPDTFAIRALRADDGVYINDYWVNSGQTSTDGRLLFGGQGGLSVVEPDRLTDWAYRPPIVVTGGRIGGKPVSVARFNGTGSTDPLVLTPETNSLEVEFAALDFTAPERNLYVYRLDGFNHEWVETDSTRRVAAYTNLPPGDYTLKLRGSNRNGLWTERTLDLPIRVLPAWYQTVGFRLAMLCLGAVAVWTLIQIRTAYLRRRQHELERQVEDRTAELLESRRRIEEIAYVDVLTSLPNRRMFGEEFRKVSALANRQSSQFALLLIDLDGFKQINDSLGHDAGDAVLIGAANRFKAGIRVSDLVFRLGGDEFAILLSHINAIEEVQAVCERILASMASEIHYRNLPLKTSVSIGAAVFPDHGTTQESLFKSADIALYQAKRSGKNTWRLFFADIDS